MSNGYYRLNQASRENIERTIGKAVPPGTAAHHPQQQRSRSHAAAWEPSCRAAAQEGGPHTRPLRGQAAFLQPVRTLRTAHRPRPCRAQQRLPSEEPSSCAGDASPSQQALARFRRRLQPYPGAGPSRFIAGTLQADEEKKAVGGVLRWRRDGRARRPSPHRQSSGSRRSTWPAPAGASVRLVATVSPCSTSPASRHRALPARAAADIAGDERWQAVQIGFGDSVTGWVNDDATNAPQQPLETPRQIATS